MNKKPVFLTLRRTFCASHRLYNPMLSETENSVLFGKCAHKNGHGHNYVVYITLKGVPDATTGMIMNVNQLKDLLETYVLADFDHHHLNMDIPEFKTLLPTVENVCMVVWERLYPHLNNRLYEVKIVETESIFARYRG